MAATSITDAQRSSTMIGKNERRPRGVRSGSGFVDRDARDAGSHA